MPERPSLPSGARSGSRPGPLASPPGAGELSPPSEPRPTSRTSLSGLDPHVDRPARVQMIVALLLFLVLIAIPLYLWRRPRAESIAASAASAPVASTPAVLAPTAAAPPAVDKRVSVGDVRVLSCHDSGPKKTPPDQCDRLPSVEHALTKAIEDTAACVSKDAATGTIQYVADVSFKRKSVALTTPKDGRTMKSTKAVAACQSAVKARIGQELAWEGIAHQHQRYRLGVTASYAPAPR